MATQQLSAVSRGTDHQGQCSARTDRGMRTPTGDYMVCAGGHAADDPHGAAFGTSGWFTWTDGQTVSLADRLAHEATSYVRSTPPAPKPKRTVLERFPAGAPRGQWPAESFAAERRRNGVPARVVMDLDSDSFLVIVEAAS